MSARHAVVFSYSKSDFAEIASKSHFAVIIGMHDTLIRIEIVGMHNTLYSRISPRTYSPK